MSDRSVLDPLAGASNLMRLTGIMNMVISSLMAVFFSLIGIAFAKTGGLNAFLVLAVLAALAFVGSFFVFSAGRAMTGRYTFSHCRLGSIIALVSGPLGLIAGLASLTALRRPEVRASFNS